MKKVYEPVKLREDSTDVSATFQTDVSDDDVKECLKENSHVCNAHMLCLF